MKRQTLLLTFFLLISLTLTSCSDKIMGYSVLLWNSPENNLQSGDVVPVYIKSNISHVYVIGTSNNEKIEIPLWQLTEPVKKAKLNGVLNKYKEHAHTYASVKSDGLPARAEPVNTSKQVYRCRKNEVIKILYQGQGQAPMTGGQPLEGNWYKILTEDGTTGWCFSYNLTLFETDANGERVGGGEIEEVEEQDEKWDLITSKVWYPDYFRTMIQSGNIDVSRLHPSYKFTFDLENNKVSLNTTEIHENWDYEGYTKTDDYEYTLKNISMKIIYKNAGYIVLRYTGESGKPQDLDFVTVEEDISEVIAAEKERRSQQYMQIWSHGPVYSSSNYGKLTFEENSVFEWTGFKLLVPTVIPAGTKSKGTASVKYSLSKDIAANYDGVISLKFDNSSQEINFLYKIEDDGLLMEDTVGAEMKGNQIITRGVSPMKLYFKRISKSSSNFPAVSTE